MHFSVHVTAITRMENWKGERRHSERNRKKREGKGMERHNGKEGWGHEGGEKTIKTVDRHFGFPRLHLVITSRTH